MQRYETSYLWISGPDVKPLNSVLNQIVDPLVDYANYNCG